MIIPCGNVARKFAIDVYEPVFAVKRVRRIALNERQVCVRLLKRWMTTKRWTRVVSADTWTENSLRPTCLSRTNGLTVTTCSALGTFCHTARYAAMRPGLTCTPPTPRLPPHAPDAVQRRRAGTLPALRGTQRPRLDADDLTVGSGLGDRALEPNSAEDLHGLGALLHLDGSDRGNLDRATLVRLEGAVVRVRPALDEGVRPAFARLQHRRLERVVVRHDLAIDRVVVLPGDRVAVFNRDQRREARRSDRGRVFASARRRCRGEAEDEQGQ